MTTEAKWRQPRLNADGEPLNDLERIIALLAELLDRPGTRIQARGTKEVGGRMTTVQLKQGAREWELHVESGELTLRRPDGTILIAQTGDFVSLPPTPDEMLTKFLETVRVIDTW